MKHPILFLIFFSVSRVLSAQVIDADLLKIKQRMDSIEEFSARLILDIDVSFINMPTKSASLHYVKDEPMKFSSEDFVLIPKRGLDFSLSELLKYPFITVNRGMGVRNGRNYKVVNVIPTDKKADFSIATLLMDTMTMRIVESEINTKKDGTYILTMHYEDNNSLLPFLVEVSFEIERMRIPLNYMGKDTEIDREKMNSEQIKTGKIILHINDYVIRYQREYR